MGISTLPQFVKFTLRVRVGENVWGGLNSKLGVKIPRFSKISSQTLTGHRSPPVTGAKMKSGFNASCLTH
eukprot:1149523-Pelagomonas_calceolata.AAC.5